MKIAIKHNPNTISTYPLSTKVRFVNFCFSLVQYAIKRIKAKGVGVIIYKFTLHIINFYYYVGITNSNKFKKPSNVITINHPAKAIDSVTSKIYNHNFFGDN